MDNKIVKFPNSKTSANPQSVMEDLDEKLDNIQQSKMDAVISHLVDGFFTDLDTAGFTIKQDHEFVASMVLVNESLKALVYKYYDKEHPLHAIANDLVKTDDEGVSYFNGEAVMMVGEVPEDFE